MRPLWWLVGTVLVCLPSLAALSSPKDGSTFGIGLVVVAGAGIALGQWVHRADERTAQVALIAPPSLLFVAMYPVGLAGGLSLEAALKSEFQASDEGVWLIGTIAIGLLAILIRVFDSKPGHRFGAIAAIGGFFAILLIPVYGLGLVLLPAVLGYGLAARFLQDRRALLR